MTRDEAKIEIKQRYAEYFQLAKQKVKGRDTYICPICGHGKGGDGLQVVPPEKGGDGMTLHCFTCGHHGDVISFYQKEHNCSFGEAMKYFYGLFHIVPDNSIQGDSRTPYVPTPVPAKDNARQAIENPQKNFSEYYKTCMDNMDDPEVVKYVLDRGISDFTAELYRFGYDKAAKRLIIPVSDGFYIGRNLFAKTKEERYRNTPGASVELFNIQALYNAEGSPVFVTEGVFDALSIIEAGGEAVALNSAGNYGLLLKTLKNKRTSNTLVLCLDNDDIGENAALRLEEDLKAQNIDYTKINISGEYHDPNDALVGSREVFFHAVDLAKKTADKPHNVLDYIEHSMASDIDKLKSQKDRKTGFPNLDHEAGSIYSGLYVIGGISSVGKTTFIHQMADQMAERGENVLFYSLEQSRLELISKSITRQAAKIDFAKTPTSLEVRLGEYSDIVSTAIDVYKEKVDDRLSIIEGNFNCTVSFIRNSIKQFMRRNENVRPTVFVDYLQVLQAEMDPETHRKSTDTRRIIDENVTALKRLSRELDIPVIVVSSLNRGNYMTPIDFESFKESGGIEYTADVVWGLQLSVIHDNIFDSEKDVKKKREMIGLAKSRETREVELVCLKNRYGKSRYSADFNYTPRLDLFDPC